MGLEAISSTPTFISREEHTTITSSTPASFGDIPPVLRFNDPVEITLSPTSASASGSGSSVNVEGRTRGQIWVTEANVAFLPESGGQGFKLDYQSLTLHALTPASGDIGAHLYCQIEDSPASAAGAANGGMEDEDEYGEMRELRVFVADGKLSPLFEALSDCSALHDSLLPSGETSSFPFFPPGEEEDDEEWEEEDDESGGQANGNGNGDGRVYPSQSKGSGHILINFAGKEKEKEKKENKEEDVDQMERFLNLVEWGIVPKPDGWEAAETGAFEDAEDEAGGEGEVEDIDALAKRLGATKLAKEDATQGETSLEKA